PLLRGEPFKEREWVFAYLGDGRILRTRRYLLEKNTPREFGRLYDCADSRDGSGYKDVTDSDDADVLAIRKRFEGILKGLPAPILPGKEPAGTGKKGRTGKRKQEAAGSP
ncbi:MAG TPA: hypothetical protein VM238_10430, partial [Phycisphaerae bacterium]|nr:hypothetical protein [Phycisphaerae bacterium]